MTAIATGPADIRDQRWLDERVAAIEDGIESVLDIARNWSDGRNLSRLHPGTDAQTYILARVKSPLGRGVVEPLLAESNWSNRQIAAIAGVSEGTVRNELRNFTQLDRPAETLGADNKLRPASRPRLDSAPYEYGLPRDAHFDNPAASGTPIGGPARTVRAVVIDTPTVQPFRLIAQTFERDIRRLLDGYRPHLDEERFTARYGAIVAAIRAALGEGE